MQDQEAAGNQIWAVFKELAPMLDSSLKLSPNAPPKRQKREDWHQAEGVPKRTTNKDQGQSLTALTLLAKLALRLDKDIQLLKKEDTFIFFFALNEQNGCIQFLAQLTEAWAAKMEENKQATQPTQMMPLRQHLTQGLFNRLLTRLTELGDAQDGSEMQNAALKSLVLLQDKTVPYLEWDHTKKDMKVANRRPLTLKRLHQICTDLLECLTDTNLVVKFHALPTNSQSKAHPWKLQVSLRADRPWLLLQELSQSAIWLLLGCNLRQHSLTKSPLAFNLEKALNLGPPAVQKPKGKGKGKHKTKSSSNPTS